MHRLPTLLLRSKKQKEKNRNRSGAAELLTVNYTMPSSLSASHKCFDVSPPWQAANPSVCLGLVPVACWSARHFTLHFVLAGQLTGVAARSSSHASRWSPQIFRHRPFFGPRQRSSSNLSHAVP